MAVTTNRRVIILDAAADEISFPFQANCIRWVGGASAADALTLSESASVSGGSITNIIWDTVAGGANNVEESLRNWKFDYGLRIETIDSGTLYVYIDDRTR